MMASMSYLQKFIIVSARQNLSPGTTTIKSHLETGHMKMIPNLRNIFGVSKIEIRTLILNGPFLKNLLDLVLYQNRAIFAS